MHIPINRLFQSSGVISEYQKKEQSTMVNDTLDLDVSQRIKSPLEIWIYVCTFASCLQLQQLLFHHAVPPV